MLCFFAQHGCYLERYQMIHKRNQVLNKATWDAGLKGVVVFMKQIFNLVQCRNMVINYNDHNPLRLFFPGSDRDGYTFMFSILG